MTAYEIMKARYELEDKMVELRDKIRNADEAMRSAYKIYLAAELDTDNFSNEQLEELCNAYEAQCEIVDKLEEEMEVIENAIEVFRNMETVVDDLFRCKIWEG